MICDNCIKNDVCRYMSLESELEDTLERVTRSAQISSIVSQTDPIKIHLVCKSFVLKFKGD